MTDEIRCPRCGARLRAEPLRRRLEGICPRCLAAELLRMEESPRPRRRVWGAVVAASILVLGILAVVLWPRRPPPPPVAAELPFREWRERLIASKAVIIGFKATSGERTFAGKFILQRPNLLCLRMTSHPDAEDWRVVSDGKRLERTRGGSTRHEDAPADLYSRVACDVASRGIVATFADLSGPFVPGAARRSADGILVERSVVAAGTTLVETYESVRFDEPVELEMFTVKD